LPLCHFVTLPLLFCPSPAAAQLDDRHPQIERIVELHGAVAGAFARQAIPEAEAALRELIDLEPHNFVNWYNLACARARQDDAEQACDYLMGALERGFIDLNQLKGDPNLEPIRESETYRKVVANWQMLVDKHVDANLAVVQKQYNPRLYETVKDHDLRLAYYSAFDPESFEDARREIDLIAKWASDNVFENVNTPEFLSDKPWIIVLLPNRRDFVRWATSVYGPEAINSMNQIGGSYMHDKKQLVAQDLGSSLRHEFFHVLHWRDNMQHRQAHPVWIQEGLCSLIEDYDVKEGDLVPAPSWRTNTAVRLANGGSLMHLTELATLPRGRFTGSRPLAHYAQARTLFLYLYRMGKLKAWYETYRRTYSEDPTGIRALEIVFGADIDQVNDDYQSWVRLLPEIPEWNRTRDGFVSIGVDINPGDGDGPIIEHVARREAQAAGLRARDVITAIDGRPTRDVHELLRVLNDYDPGDTIEISYRRRNRHETASVTLTERR
jgi:hypothetical protein